MNPTPCPADGIPRTLPDCAIAPCVAGGTSSANYVLGHDVAGAHGTVAHFDVLCTIPETPLQLPATGITGTPSAAASGALVLGVLLVLAARFIGAHR